MFKVWGLGVRKSALNHKSAMPPSPLARFLHPARQTVSLHPIAARIGTLVAAPKPLGKARITRGGLFCLEVDSVEVHFIGCAMHPSFN